MIPPVIHLGALDVRFGRMPVLRDVTLEVPAGSAIGIVGPNGSGKTTLLRVLATLIRPAAGTGTVLGAALGTTAVYDVRGRIDMIGHRPALYGELTLRENLEFVSKVTGSAGGVLEALEAVGLSRAASRRADQASWGMQRRVEFGRLLMTAPDLILMDEPHAGLDAAASVLVGLVIDQVRSRRGAAVLASHEAETVVGLTDKVYQLADGTLTSMKQVPA